MFWVGAAAVLAALSAIPLLVGLNEAADQHTGPITIGWIWVGAIGLVLAVAALGWSVILQLAHGYAARLAERTPGDARKGIGLSGDLQTAVIRGWRPPEGDYFKGQRIHIADFVREGDPAVIRGKTFEDCTLDGPAILSPKGVGIMEEVHFDTVGTDFYTVPEGTLMTGVVVVDSCVFRRCTFHRIAVMGDPVLGKRWRSEMVPTMASSQTDPTFDHNVAAVGKQITCTCSRQFDTGVEFKEHQAKELGSKEDDLEAAVLIVGGGMDVSIPEPPDGSCRVRPYVDVRNYSSFALTVQMIRLSRVIGDGIVTGPSASDTQILPPNDGRRFWIPAFTVPVAPTTFQDLDYEFRYGRLGKALAVRASGRCRVTAQQQAGNVNVRDNSLEFVRNEVRERL